MADIRDIMRDRLPSFEKYLGQLTAAGQSTEPLNVRHFQKGTITIDVAGKGGAKLHFILEGTDNKGLDRWFNLDPLDEDVEITADGNHAATYVAEISWIRLRWVSGTATRVKVSANISKTIIGKH